jgi:hypothetical protein
VATFHSNSQLSAIASGTHARLQEFNPRHRAEEVMRQKVRIPSHLPVGTRYVIEGRNGRIVSEYLELPNGHYVELVHRQAPPMARPSRARRRSKAA